MKTDDLIKAFNEMRESEEELNLAKIARRFRTSRALVAQRLERAKIYVPSRPHKVKLSPELLAEARRMYVEEGRNLGGIAEHLGIGESTLWRIFRDIGVKTRSKTEHMSAWHAEHKAKLQEYERLRAAAKPQKRGGRPKGMTEETIEEARQLLQHMSNFENKNGTKSGALVYAARKVYGGTVDSRKATARANKTLGRYRATKVSETGQKPAA